GPRLTASPENPFGAKVVVVILREAGHVRAPVRPCRFPVVRASSDFMKLAARIIAYHGLSPMLRLSANSSPNSGQQSGSRRIWFQLPKVLTEAEVIEAEE